MGEDNQKSISATKSPKLPSNDQKKVKIKSDGHSEDGGDTFTTLRA